MVLIYNLSFGYSDLIGISIDSLHIISNSLLKFQMIFSTLRYTKNFSIIMWYIQVKILFIVLLTSWNNST